MEKQPRILVIRGGAIGDFILTLPAIGALRERWREAHIEILGYSHIIELASGRFYAQATRSIEYGALSAFFSPCGELDKELSGYFASFDIVISYLYDPDKFFENNLRWVGVQHLIVGSSKPTDLPAAAHFAKPLESLAIYPENLQPRVHPSQEDLKFGRKFVGGVVPLRIAVHCGSGSAKKNWPPQFFAEVCQRFRFMWEAAVVCVSGEADTTATAEFLLRLGPPAALEARGLTLPQLAGVLSECHVFMGNDSGISHLAASLGVPTVVMWFPGSSPVWQPQGRNVRVVPFNIASPLRVQEVVADLIKEQQQE